MVSKARILVIDDREEIRLSARFLLEDNGYEVSDASDLDQAKTHIALQKTDLALLDMNYSRDTTSGEEGLRFLSWLASSPYHFPVVVMTAWSNVDLAVKCMQLGAGDFITKPWKNQRLLQVIKQQLDLEKLKNENRKLHQRLEESSQNPYQWRSSCMKNLLDQLHNIADTDVTVLLTGENGTGKSQMARYIHDESRRATSPFISVNMGGLTENLFESEMFGHRRGAFTDAKSDRIGRFGLAEGGTLFMDEIANIPLSQQAKLLRVFESNEYEVLGSSQTIKADVRIISATNGNIEKLIANGKMREDLYYRLNILAFHLPPLRDRNSDIVPLAEHFIGIYSAKHQRGHLGLDDSVARSLETYHWPGNIRELDHMMQRAVLLARKNVIEIKDLNFSPTQNVDHLPQMTLEELEIRMIKQTLSAVENNISKTAQMLGITKSSLYRRLDKYAFVQKAKS